MSNEGVSSNTSKRTNAEKTRNSAPLERRFDVEFRPNYLPRLLSELGLSYAFPCTEWSVRPEEADDILD